MKLLRVKANHFKNCCDDYTIDLVAKSRKTAEDKEYELQEIAPGLFTFSTMAFIGKNASGKTSALELLDCCFSILGQFRLEGREYSYDGIELEIVFYHDGSIYLYEVTLATDTTASDKAIFKNQHIYKKTYYKTNLKEIYDKNSFIELTNMGELPEDTSKIFFVLKEKKVLDAFYDISDESANAYKYSFFFLKYFNLDTEILYNILRIFDRNINDLKRIDDHNYILTFKNKEHVLTDAQLIHRLSSGTTKGILLYTLLAASLKVGFDLLIDEVENHFHKTLVENMISLYKDKTVNKHNATLIFTTHYCEVIDQMGRQDNIWVCKTDNQVHLSNMYEDYQVRPELLKSKQYYNNVFQTAVNYDELMNLKRLLKK